MELRRWIKTLLRGNKSKAEQRPAEKPRVGAVVECITDDRYLIHWHHASRGQIGVVVSHEVVNPDAPNLPVMIDWGRGGGWVRCDNTEYRTINPGEIQ